MWQRRAISVAGLLCLSLAAASLDRVPDPPAVKQRVDQWQTIDFSEQLQHAAGESRQLQLSDLSAMMLSPVSERTVAPPSIVGESPLLRQAADPSPPTRVR